MKKLVLPLLSVAMLLVLSSVASAEIKLTDNLSISGFLDMSSVTTMGDDTEIGASFDQFELDFHFTDGSVTGQADIDSTGDGSTMFLEQAFVSYALPKDMLPGTSITVGRFASSLGFEGFEPVDLYQYSYSEGSPYPLYQNGVAISVNPMDMLGIYVAAVSGVWDVTDTDIKDPGFEAQVAVTPMEQLTAKVGFAMEKMTLGKTEKTQTELNAWASFTQGPLTLGGEIDLLGNWMGADDKGNAVFRDSGIHFLGMANLSLEDMISAPVSATVRFSGISLDGEDPSTEITFSPSYSATENWLLLAEVKRLINAESTEIAVESLFSF
jgi:hypothetical protein